MPVTCTRMWYAELKGDPAAPPHPTIDEAPPPADANRAFVVTTVTSTLFHFPTSCCQPHISQAREATKPWHLFGPLLNTVCLSLENKEMRSGGWQGCLPGPAVGQPTRKGKLNGVDDRARVLGRGGAGETLFSCLPEDQVTPQNTS